jgi:hemin uptake protein HemP
MESKVVAVPMPGPAEPDPRKDCAMNAYVEPQSLVMDTTPVHDATHLTAGGQLARIVLNGQVYSLRITRAGKLILTK